MLIEDDRSLPDIDARSIRACVPDSKDIIKGPARSGGGDLVLAGLSERVVRALEQAGVAAVFDVSQA